MMVRAGSLLIRRANNHCQPPHSGLCLRRIGSQTNVGRNSHQHRQDVHEMTSLQNLILEILQAQPSLRDSKTYLNSFGPRKARGGAGSKETAQSGRQARAGIRPQHLHQLQQRPSTPAPPFPFGKNAEASQRPDATSLGQEQEARLDRPPLEEETANVIARAKRRDLEQALPPDVLDHVNQQRAANEAANKSSSAAQTDGSFQTAADLTDSHHFAQPDLAIRNAPDPALTHAGLSAPVTPASQSQLAEMLSSPPVQQHTALVKVQGPFTSRQLESIADGMVYLKRLGLVSVIVLDSEDSAWRSAVSEFDRESGIRIDNEADRDDDVGMAMWRKSSAVTPLRQSRSASVGKVQEVLRKHMLTEVTRLAELLSAKGASARPFPHAMMRVDAAAVAKADQEFPPNLVDSHVSSQSYSWARPNEGDINRSPLVSDDALSSVRSALAHDTIPVIAPLALYDDPEAFGAPRTVCVDADDVLVGLAREMATEARATEKLLEEDDANSFTDGVDMMPLRLMVINREGGIPSHARGGNPHLSINLASEYGHIMNSFVWHESNPTATANLQMVRDCLAFMPHTSSGVVVSHRSPKSLIANLITNKAAHSPSLPHRLLAGRQDVRHTPTIIRPGLPIRILQKFEDVDQGKMTALLEGSFRKKLNEDAYYGRLKRSLDFVIVMGDYEGAAIVTHEWAPGDDHAVVESIAYLDKFAVLPSLQGSGAVDFLWGALRDEVHGLGLLDALNDNGGKSGFGQGRDLVWKSRSNNPVNRWYYERSNGFVRIDTSNPSNRDPEQPVDLAWCLFWADAEQRIAAMSGERRLGAEATADDVYEMAHEKKPSFAHETVFGHSQNLRRKSANMLEDERSDDGHNGQSTSLRRLSELRHTETGSERLLPIVSVDEQGRLDRWARCMATIPSAWAN